MDESKVISNKYWIQCRILLKIAGLWPYQKKYINIIIRVLLSIGIYSMMIPQMARGALEFGKNLDIVLENISGFFYFVSAVTKYYSNIIFISKLQYLYEEITKDWDRITDEKEKNILKRYANHGRWISNFYNVYVYAAGTIFPVAQVVLPTIADIILPLNQSRQQKLCYYGEYFFIDQEAHLYALMVHTILAILCTVIIFSSIDGTYVCAVQHSLAQFHITDYQLQRVVTLMEKNANYKFEEKEYKIHEYVCTTIKRHLKALQFVTLLQSTYSVSVFLNITCILAGLITGVPIVMMTINDLPNFIRTGLLFVAAIITLFFLNWPGQKIHDSSSYIFYSTYFCCWYKLPIKTQRLLKLMMLRAKTPCQLSAGPLVVLNFKTFCGILKTAISYVTAVLTMEM